MHNYSQNSRKDTINLKDIPFQDFTLKFTCRECTRFVHLNVVFLGRCFQTDKIHLEFRKSNKKSQRQSILDFTNVLISRDLIDDAEVLMRDETGDFVSPRMVREREMAATLRNYPPLNANYHR